MSSEVLVVDDDPVQRRLLEAALLRAGYRPRVADGGQAAFDLLDDERLPAPDVVILDLAMPGIDGLAVLEGMRERGLSIPVVVQTAQAGIDIVVAAMRAGAFDFVVKPVSPDKLAAAVAAAVKVGAYEGAQRSARQSSPALSVVDLASRSPAMQKVIRLAEKAAGSNIPIMIEGESGVGKEVVARAIQVSGSRRTKPFVTVNCGAIPENLVESILFGHEKGAFTGAADKHRGKFAEASGGTLFLDEIGDLPLDIQVKLLRAVQDGEIDPVGARAPRKVNIRLISATHRDLVQRVRDGLFREDLFYRLNVFPIHVPPLRDRREDIPGLVAHFVRFMSAAETGDRVKGVSGEAMSLLCAYDWPGNIRQLENAIFRAVVLCEGTTLTSEEFPQISAQVGEVDPMVAEPVHLIAEREGLPPAGETVVYDAAALTGSTARLLRALDDTGNIRRLEEIELELISHAIAHYDGQMSEVARRLGIGRSTLYRKLKEYGIDPETGRPDKLAS